MYRNRHLMVSGFFGTAFSRVHPAPRGTRSLFFTNTQAMRDEAEAKGWDTILLDRAELAPSDDPLVSSLQSKYVKFLRFRKDYPDLRRYESITYCDHKAHVKDEHLVWLMSRSLPGASALLRYSPARKDIYDEMTLAEGQPRYAHAMPQTRKWVEEVKDSRGISTAVRVANTGLIHYLDIPRMMPLLDEIHAVSMELEQPECQVLWAALAQGYEGEIQYVDWFDMDIEWVHPR